MSRRNLVVCFLAVAFISAAFFSGYVTGKAQVQTPSTVIHHVVFKWKEAPVDASDEVKQKLVADKQKVMEGLKEIVNTTPGVKNFWSKSVKIQPDTFSQTFVIEFENQAALQGYANNPKKKEWDTAYYAIRETSQNCVTTN